MKGKSRPDPASPTSPLHQVSLAGEHRSVVCHVVVRSEDLHFVLARVDHKHHVFNGDAGFRDVGSKNDLQYFFLLSKFKIVKAFLPLSRHQAPCQRLPFDLLGAIGSGEEISCGLQTHTWDAAAGRT